MKNINIVILVSLFLFSCTERIDLKLDSQEFARLVVEGHFSTDTAAHKVILTKTADYFSNEAPEPVTGAQVTISNETEFYELTETPANSGIYLTAPEVFGTVGRDYKLRILLEEEIGGAQEYEASSKIYPVNQLDSISLKFQPFWGEKGFWEVQCYVWDPPTEDYYMFLTYVNGRLVNDTISKVFVVDDLLYNGNYTNGVSVYFLDQSQSGEVVKEGDTVMLRAARITKEQWEFTFKLQEEISYQSPLFSGPPANVPGNISNGAFGFFGAYSSTFASAMVKNPEEQKSK